MNRYTKNIVKKSKWNSKKYSISIKKEKKHREQTEKKNKMIADLSHNISIMMLNATFN